MERKVLSLLVTIEDRGVLYIIVRQGHFIINAFCLYAHLNNRTMYLDAALFTNSGLGTSLSRPDLSQRGR